MSKTEAQIKSEEEVRRIMEERGYFPASNKKKVEEVFGNNFPFRPFIVGFLVIGFLVSGGILLQNNPSAENKQDDNSVNEFTSSKNDKELAEFQTCLSSIDTSEITLDDVEFWNKHINRYKQTIFCYDNYPSVADSFEKVKLQDQITKLQNNSKSAEANYTTYRANIAQIDAELARNLAEIKKRGDAWDTELSKRVQDRQVQNDERNAQYAKEQVAREQQSTALEAQRQQEQAAKKAKCDNYKSTYGEKMATEIAEADSEVIRVKHNWTKAQRKIKNCKGGNIVYNQSSRELCNSYRDQEVQVAESLYSIYTSLLQQKTIYYRNLKNEACNY